MSLCFLIIASPWFWICHWRAAHVNLSDNRRCTLEYCRWYSGGCVLSCFQNDVRTGTVDLVSGMLEHPWAMFPGPDGNTVICCSILDTTYAAFTVDVTKLNDDPQFTRLHLQVPVEPVIERSDFLVRACTAKEMEFVRQYVQTVDLNTLGKSMKGGAITETRKNVLTYLTWSTSPNNWQDPVTKFAKPQILPRN